MKIFKNQSKSFNVKGKKTNYNKKNKAINFILTNNTSNYLQKFKHQESKTKSFFNKIKIKNFILFYIIAFILSNINGILCESYIIVKINKSGHFNFLFKGGINDENLPCYGVSKHTPNLIYINDALINDNSIDEYDFVQPVNTMKLVYDDTKDSYACLFNECSDIDEIDASHLITTNVNNMDFMFHQCSSLTSLNINNFNIENVKSMKSMFGFCSSLTSIDGLNSPNFDVSFVEFFDNMFDSCKSLISLDLSNFHTLKAQSMNKMFHYCTNLKYLDIHNFVTSSVVNM